jgi:threonylcarbamoyladenosine tRNA methylthiotransferase MtaB
MKIFYQTFGCKANQYDTELLRTKFASGGAETVADAAAADICLVNSCSVTAVADRECRQVVRRLVSLNPTARIIVTGCYASHAPEELKALSPRVEVYSNEEKETLPACVGFEVDPNVYGLSRFSTRIRAFVKIQDGCKAPCRYCIIPQTRPDLWNKPVDHALKEVETLVREGHGEVVLTGIRLGLYRGEMSDGGPRLSLVELLKKMIALPYKFRVRLSSLEVTEVTPELVALAASTPKICRHFHIPMQSADDGVLKDMGRWYQFSDYKERVDMLRAAMPDVGLTADVMVGFPTETDERFDNTYRRIESLGMTGLHVFRYSKRPGTEAAQLPALNVNTVKERAARLISLADKMKKDFHQKHAGTVREVLAEPEGSGWTDNYIRIALPAPAAAGSLVFASIP